MGNAASSTVAPGKLGATDGLLTSLPLYPTLIAAYSVLRLYSDNVYEVEGEEVIGPLLLVVTATAVGQIMLSVAWRDRLRAAFLTAAVVIPLLNFRLVADTVASVWPYEEVVRAYLMTLLGGIAVVCLALSAALKMTPPLATVTQGLNVAAIVLVVLTMPPIAARAVAGSGVPHDAGSAPHMVSGPAPTARSESGTRDIYHLVLDRYGSNEALLGRFGIDNSDFTDWLAGQGFQVIDDARANYERTVLSLSSTLGMTLHDDLARQMTPGGFELGPLHRLIRSSPAGAVLQQAGYRYYHIGSWFAPTAVSDIADYVTEPSYIVSFGSMLLDQTAVGGLDAINASLANARADGKADATVRQIKRIKDVSLRAGPKYVFAHLLIPHDPYLFLEDGTYDPERASFRTQLAFANAQLRAIIDPLLALPPEEQPIIIVQADEGPYPAGYGGGQHVFDWSGATPDDVVEKFGVLNAMYLPGPEGEVPIAPGTTLVNTYPEVFQRYLGLDVPRLPDRVFAMGIKGPYDMLEITETLGALSNAD